MPLRTKLTQSFTAADDQGKTTPWTSFRLLTTRAPALCPERHGFRLEMANKSITLIGANIGCIAFWGRIRSSIRMIRRRLAGRLGDEWLLAVHALGLNGTQSEDRSGSHRPHLLLERLSLPHWARRGLGRPKSYHIRLDSGAMVTFGSPQAIKESLEVHWPIGRYDIHVGPATGSPHARAGRRWGIAVKQADGAVTMAEDHDPER